jgi:tetratricopeptide (TPR) repeat protein
MGRLACVALMTAALLGTAASATVGKGEDTSTKHGLGDCATREIDLVISSCTQLIQKKRNIASARAYLHRGEAYYKMGDYRRAIADLDQTIRLKPGNAEAHVRRARPIARKVITFARLPILIKPCC